MGCTPSTHSSAARRQTERPLEGSSGSRSADRRSSLSEERISMRTVPTPTSSRYPRRVPGGSGRQSHHSEGQSLTEEPAAWPTPHAVIGVVLNPSQPPVERCATPRPTDAEQAELWANVTGGTPRIHGSPSDRPLGAITLSETVLRIRDKYEADIDEPAPHPLSRNRSNSESFGSDRPRGGSGRYENPLGPLGDAGDDFLDEIGMPSCESDGDSESLAPQLSPRQSPSGQQNPETARAVSPQSAELDARSTSPEAAWEAEGAIPLIASNDGRRRLTRRILEWSADLRGAAAPIVAPTRRDTV